MNVSRSRYYADRLLRYKPHGGTAYSPGPLPRTVDGRLSMTSSQFANKPVRQCSVDAGCTTTDRLDERRLSGRRSIAHRLDRAVGRRLRPGECPTPGSGDEPAPRKISAVLAPSYHLWALHPQPRSQFTRRYPTVPATAFRRSTAPLECNALVLRRQAPLLTSGDFSHVLGLGSGTPPRGPRTRSNQPTSAPRCRTCENQ